MNAIELCKLIDDGQHEELQAAGINDCEDAMNLLSSRYQSLHKAAMRAESVMRQHVYPKPDVSEDHPWSILVALQDELEPRSCATWME